MGKHIDIVAGLYDDRFLEERGCKAAHLYDKKLSFAVPVTHPLCERSEIDVSDLKGATVMLIRKNWNEYIDRLRKDLTDNGTVVEDFDMFNMSAFNRAARENLPIITVEGWEDVHPLLRIVPAAWGTLCDMNTVALYLSGGHKTVENIRARKAFTVAIADKAHTVAADYVGLVSAHTEKKKMEKSGFTTVKSARGRADRRAVAAHP